MPQPSPPHPKIVSCKVLEHLLVSFSSLHEDTCKVPQLQLQSHIDNFPAMSASGFFAEKMGQVLLLIVSALCAFCNVAITPISSPL